MCAGSRGTAASIESNRHSAQWHSRSAAVERGRSGATARMTDSIGLCDTQHNSSCREPLSVLLACRDALDACSSTGEQCSEHSEAGRTGEYREHRRHATSPAHSQQQTSSSTQLSDCARGGCKTKLARIAVQYRNWIISIVHRPHRTCCHTCIASLRRHHETDRLAHDAVLWRRCGLAQRILPCPISHASSNSRVQRANLKQ